MSVPKQLDWKHYGVVKYAQSEYHVWRVKGPGDAEIFQVTNSRDITPPFGVGAYTALAGVMARFDGKHLERDAEETP